MSSNENKESKGESFIPAISEFSGDGFEKSPENILDLLETNLPRYQTGSPEDPSRGYTDFDLMDCPQEIRHVIGQEVNNVVKITHKKESYGTSKAYIHGEISEVHTIDFEYVNAYWIGNIVVFEGSKSSVSTVQNDIQRHLFNVLRIQNIKLDPSIYRRLEDFPLKYVEGLQLNETLSMSIEGADDISQMRIYGRDSSDEYDRYLPKHGKISYLMGEFQFHDYQILTDISEDLIHIRKYNKKETDEGEENPISEDSRLFVILAFLRRLIEISRTKGGK
ncbi:hypothetical protein [Haloarcula sp. K1]|uniref:hypothetical protein n=1 Tax=Haloarcula sp. K1 TaxID=1622207 RepID=UPI000A81716E|nr:hypothetical protein [Haloarcula sp. K1]